MLGRVGPNELSLHQVARFANHPVHTIDGLHWDVLDLYRQVLDGLRKAARQEPALASIGVDSWAVDYALVNGDRMLGNPYHYREQRTRHAVAATHELVNPAELYSRTGLQFQPFNTVYQLTADRLTGSLRQADAILLIPDLITFWLTGTKVAEATNASTTGLISVRTGGWDAALIARLSLRHSQFPDLVRPGTMIGHLLPAVSAEVGGNPGLQVVTVGSHDTASAVVAAPMTSGEAAFISCGTWSLVGVELEKPVLTEASRRANFTNEGGVDGRVRYLRNVMGLWLLSESIRAWDRAGTATDLAALLAAAAEVEPSSVTVFDVDDPRFLAPGDMPARIADYCTEHGLLVPRTPVEMARSIIESLAAAYALALRAASELSGASVRTVHIVGGGSQNELLCQLTANHSGLPVLAGPAEATAIGNVLIQARAQGLAAGSLESLRSLVRDSFKPVLYAPRARYVAARPPERRRSASTLTDLSNTHTDPEYQQI
jgi:rhamnulokinase